MECVLSVPSWFSQAQNPYPWHDLKNRILESCASTLGLETQKIPITLEWPASETRQNSVSTIRVDLVVAEQVRFQLETAQEQDGVFLRVVLNADRVAYVPFKAREELPALLARVMYRIFPGMRCEARVSLAGQETFCVADQP